MTSHPADSDLSAILSSYITRRDSAKKSSPFYIAGNTGPRAMSQFSQMIDAHHMLAAEQLPPMNLERLHEFAELLTATLSWMRVTGSPRPEVPEHLAFYDRLPALTLAQMEAFVELMNSRMAWMRMPR